MFYGDPTIRDYREMSLNNILIEFLKYKGTWDEEGNKINETIKTKELVDSALFIYGLKSNPTNRRAVEYFCEREARRGDIMLHDKIVVPANIWNECNEYNKKFCGKK